MSFEDLWIFPKDLAEGNIEGLPKMSIQLQNSLRKSRKLTYSKLGRNIVYKRAWVEKYLESNIRKAQPKAE